MTLKHFSMRFRFDLCFDFSFWKAETGRCIPKDLISGLNFYTFTPLCNRTEYKCTDQFYDTWKEYCPNKDESCEGYGQETHFFCKESKTCIPIGK